MVNSLENLEWYWWALGILGSAFSAAFFAGAYITRWSGRLILLEQHQTGLYTAIEKLNKEIGSRLYLSTGGLIYRQAQECDKLREDCPMRAACQNMEKKLNTLIELHLQRIPDNK